MKQTKHKMLKSIVSSSLAVTMLAPVISTLPANAMEDVEYYSYDEFDIEYHVVGEWENHKNIMITVINNSDEPMYNWAFKFDANGKIGDIWGAEKIECIDNDYVIGSLNYDSKIDNCVTFGYILECDNETVEAPEEFKLCTKRVDLESGYDISIDVVSEWNDSYIGEVMITNTSEEPIVGWNLTFDSANNISTLWNAEISDSADGKYLVTPGDYGYYIDPGTTVQVGFIADKLADAELKLDSFGLSAVVRDWDFAETPDFTDTTDTDGDMIPDVYEKHVYGTDPKKKDTDGDNLPDGYEIMTLKTNPREADSDFNGATDDKEDFDSDKLTNFEEYELGTNPFVADTDEDGLSDYDEVKVYGTNPLKVDTDEDTVWDADEIKLGLDPTDGTDGNTPVKQTVSEEELEINEYNDDFQISLDVTASNIVSDYLEQEESPYSGILSDNRSIIGTPIKLEYTGGTITEGTITFRMNEDTINSASHYFEGYDAGLERYGVFIYDEDVCTLVPVPAEYDEENHTISIDASVFMGNLMIIDYESLMYDLGIDPRDGSEEDTESDEEAETAETTEVEVETAEEEAVVITDEAVDTEAESAASEDDSDKTEADVEITAAEADKTETETTTADTDTETATASAIESAVEALETSEIISADVTESEEAIEADEVEATEEELVLDSAVIESKLMMSAPAKLAPAPKSSPNAWRQVDLVIVIDTTGSMDGSIAKIKTNLTNLIDKLRDDNISLYVSLIDFKDIAYSEPTVVNNNNGKDFYNSIDDVKSAISGMKASGGWDDPETDIDGLGQASVLNYRSAASKYLFLITDTTYKVDNNFGFTSLTEVADALHNKGIMTNIIVPSSYYNTYAPLVSDPDKSKIAISSAFCDSMYDIISNSNTATDAVVIGSNLVTGCFKSKLTYGGPTNSDTDGLTDSEEVNWDWVKSLDTKTGNYKLFTWKELCEKSKFLKSNPYKNGKTNSQFKMFKDIEVVPATSNPFSNDSDGDYYPDDEEKLENRMARNNMYINDSALDDYYYNSGKSFSETESPEYTDGVFFISSSKGPANTQQLSWYEFTRKTNTNYYFNLTPCKKSFYKFDSYACINRSIKVTYKSWGKTKTVSPESDGTYLLDNGTKYTIKFYAEADYSATYKDCVFTVSQDNWVYAPNGGLWEVTKYSTGNVVASNLNDETIYLPSSRIVSAIAELTGGTSVVCDPDGDMEAQIRQILTNNGMKVDESELKGALKTIGGAVGTTILFFLPVPGGKVTGGAKVVKLIVSGITNYCTYSGVPDAISTLLKYMEQYGFKEAYEKGHANVYTCHNIGIGRNWNAWETAPYIRKISNDNIGKVDTNVSDAKIIDFCDWEVSDPA